MYDGSSWSLCDLKHPICSTELLQLVIGMSRLKLEYSRILCLEITLSGFGFSLDLKNIAFPVETEETQSCFFLNARKVFDIDLSKYNQRAQRHLKGSQNENGSN